MLLGIVEHVADHRHAARIHWPLPPNSDRLNCAMLRPPLATASSMIFTVSALIHSVPRCPR